MTFYNARQYEDCLLYFGIREQTQILIIENRFIIRQLATKPLRIGCDMTSFSEKSGDHLLGTASCASNFCWIETPIQSTAVYFRAHTRKSTIHHVLRCHRRVSKHRNRIFKAFLSTNRHKPFFERLTNCVGSNANKYFWQSSVHAILNVCWSHYCLRLSQSHDRLHDDLAISVGAQHQWFPQQQLILDDFHEICLGVNYNLSWIHRKTLILDGSSSPKI